jgi:hypothetical protein
LALGADIDDMHNRLPVLHLSNKAEIANAVFPKAASGPASASPTGRASALTRPLRKRTIGLAAMRSIFFRLALSRPRQFYRPG